MKDKPLHLPNEEFEGLESFLLVFYVHINMAFCFYTNGSLQVLSCDSRHSFEAVEIRSK